MHAAYAAGMMDADGCYSIIAHKQKAGYFYYQLEARINLTDIDTLKSFQEAWGGSFSRMTGDHKVLRKNKPSYQWYVRNDAAAVLFEAVLPYAITKLPQVELGLAFFGLQKALDSRLDTASGVYAKASAKMKDLKRLVMCDGTPMDAMQASATIAGHHSGLIH